MENHVQLLLLYSIFSIQSDIITVVMENKPKFTPNPQLKRIRLDRESGANHDLNRLLDKPGYIYIEKSFLGLKTLD